MTITIEKSKKTNQKQLRVGAVVETRKRGLGILVWRNKKECWVAHPRVEYYQGRRIETAERYSYKILDGIMLSNQPIDLNSGFYKGAWSHIWVEAQSDNSKWEFNRSRLALQNLPRLQGVTYKEREVSFQYGHAKYLRMTLEGVFDFEISTYPTVSLGLHELVEGMVELWKGKPYDSIKVLDYNGQFTRRQADWHDFNYGMAYGWSEADRKLAEVGA